jgi:glycerol kinase
MATTRCSNDYVPKFPVRVDLFDNVFRDDYFDLLCGSASSSSSSSSTTATATQSPPPPAAAAVTRTPTTNTIASSTSSLLLLVGAIDQGTSSTKFIIYTRRSGRIAAIGQMEHTQYYPQSGWHEHDPYELWGNVVTCINAVYNEYRRRYLPTHKRPLVLASIGITNQRETTIVWNRANGVPYYNAIVWDCSRTADIAEELILREHDDINSINDIDDIDKINTNDNDTIVAGKDRYRSFTGLPISSYFAGTKVRWLIENVASLRADLERNDHRRADVCFGTVDTWLLYQLTSYREYKTDVSNASRWLFLDIRTGRWDQRLVDTICRSNRSSNITMKSSNENNNSNNNSNNKRSLLKVDSESMLPEICPSSCIFGHCTNNELPDELHNVPIGSILGDQQAALFGQAAYEPGQAKSTVRTSMTNTRNKRLFLHSLGSGCVTRSKKSSFILLFSHSFFLHTFSNKYSSVLDYF